MNPAVYFHSANPLPDQQQGQKHPQDPYRDDSGKIKRQAARFRVYGYNKNGNVVAEIPHDENTRIEWKVEVANSKPQWFDFLAAMDIPEMKGVSLNVRNPNVKNERREGLAIKPGVTSIQGRNQSGKDYQMVGDFVLPDKEDRTKNITTKVKLGDLRTDDAGRLIVLPGPGKSDSPTGQPAYIPAKPDSFSNAAGWYDDVCDGPVSATVYFTIGQKIKAEKRMEADPAWVISAPPNYAPDTIGWRTMNDLMREVFMEAGMMSMPTEISFREHIMPVFQRLTGLQWVNNAFASFFGAGTPLNFDNPLLYRQLARKGSDPKHDPFQEARRTFYNSFRANGTLDADINSWPLIYGDAFGTYTPPPGEPESPRTYLELPGLFDYFLKKWVDGDYVDDVKAGYRPQPRKMDFFSKVPPALQPDMLDQAAMHFCLADAFHPGCELTWPMRHASMYRAPYRIRNRKPGTPEPDYGTSITQEQVVGFGGPLYEQGPGDLTRWMALPWQGDTAYCRSGYNPEFDPWAPAYWPARVPNAVLTQEDYQQLMSAGTDAKQKLELFRTRTSWYHIIPRQSANETMLWMVNHFNEMGIVEERPGPTGVPGVPATIYVEIGTEKPRKKLLAKLDSARELESFDAALFQKTGFHDQKHLEEFKAVRFGRNRNK